MRKRGRVARRPAAEWAARGLLALALAAVAYVSLAHSLAAATKRRPDFAHALAPTDGQITARRSHQYVKLNSTPADLKAAEQLARLALRQDGTAIQALSTLGFVKQLRGDSTGARRLFLHAQALSRRDLPTQLWAIEDAVARDDIAGALRHYDIALRTSRVAPDTLFPVLANASADPVIRPALSATLAANPAWGPVFVEFAGKNAPDARSTALLFRSLGGTKLTVPEEAQSTLVQRLLTAGFAEDAWRHYASFRKAADRRSLRDPRFTAELVSPTPFDWTLASNTAITTSIQHGDQGGVFDFSAPPSIGGTLLQQVQMLPPGTYQLEGQSRGVEQSDESKPYWVLTCFDGLELGRAVLASSGDRLQDFVGRFRVPAACPLQTLALIARPSSSMAGLSGQIESVNLRPVSN